jgi:acyl carrier protein
MSTESLLIRIFENVIGVCDLHRDARFVDIGGNSLNLVAILKQIKEKTGVSPPARMFFDKSASTIAALSSAIDTQRAQTLSTVSATD